MFNLNNLVSLDLTSSGFLSPLPDGPWNLTSIITLNISDNEMNGSLPSQLFGLSGLVSMNLKSHLASLDISFNQLQDPLPSGFSNLTFLKNLDVSGNRMNSHIPNQIYDLTNLESLRLSDNQLQGTISNSISNLTSLSALYLSGNMLTGEIPKQIGNLNKLQELYLFGNRLTGEIPKQIGNLNKLQELNLATNRLCGPLPENLGYSFPMIERLYISDNKLEGIVTENHFVNLTKLTILDASGNRLTMRVNPNWTPPFQLDQLYLSGWNLGPQFPLWLQSQHQISFVDISNAGIEGELPPWLWNFSSQILFVNVSHNQLRGQIQNILSHSTREIGMPFSVFLSSNQFIGPLPRISIHIIELDLSDNSFSGNISNFLCHAQKVQYDLRILHLGGNDLFGEIPDCWMHWPYLEVLNMKENKLIGSIPNSIRLLSKLESLDMHKNMLSGPIPLLQNCSSLLKVDLAENGFTGKIPRWLGTSLSHLIILRLRSNKFNGELSPEFCHLTSLRILDISNNNFSGVIPKCLKNLTAMINEGELPLLMGYSFFGKIFGESALVTTKGHEYEYFTIILKLFVSMDFSNNNFNGDIPIELTNLEKFHQASQVCHRWVLDLSYNNLSGKIPSGTQLQGFNASCYIGNNLCGPPLSKSCSSIDDGKIPKNESERDDGCEVDWFYVSMVIGFAVGSGSIYGSFVSCKILEDCLF
ncbi:PREDICTED: LRR receptor-like serine/threonine-protein kinase GSO1 [Ipomoea nil]|uniref:LRR receptor-like serine/threonine-protein kinase GSO1 n=1 Tax=Ipomoea nil TaxID=35883 RepID=UPI000901AD15|nr:PREDICTED: LRR receptor-like serine/threonine-protein kinase GSO1 [Ipomoea nil]